MTLIFAGITGPPSDGVIPVPDLTSAPPLVDGSASLTFLAISLFEVGTNAPPLEVPFGYPVPPVPPLPQAGFGAGVSRPYLRETCPISVSTSLVPMGPPVDLGVGICFAGGSILPLTGDEGYAPGASLDGWVFLGNQFQGSPIFFVADFVADFVAALVAAFVATLVAGFKIPKPTAVAFPISKRALPKRALLSYNISSRELFS